MKNKYLGTVRASTLKVLFEIVDERNRQLELWGDQDHPVGIDPQSTFHLTIENVFRARYEKGLKSWANIIGEEFGEFLIARNKKDVRKELIETAACCVAALENMDKKKEGRNGKGKKVSVTRRGNH